MNDSYEDFKTIMEENTNGHEVRICFGRDPDNYPAVRLFEYKNYPTEGQYSILTYGLSHVSNSDWKDNKPEFLMTVDSNIEEWSAFLGLIISKKRNQSSFSDGYCCFSKEFFLESTKMQGICFGGKANLPINPIKLCDRSIIVRTAFPIYLGEISIIKKEGLNQFIERIGINDIYGTKRVDLSDGYIPNDNELEHIDFITKDECEKNIAVFDSAVERIKILINKCLSGEYDPYEIRSICIDLSNVEKKILEEYTLTNFNKVGPKSRGTTLLLTMMHFSTGSEFEFQNGKSVLRIYEEAEAAFKEEDWNEAYKLYLKLAPIGLFRLNYLRQNMAICKINCLTNKNSDTLDEINKIIEILNETGDNERANLISKILCKKLATI